AWSAFCGRRMKVTNVSLSTGAKASPREGLDERSSPIGVSLSTALVFVLVALGIALRLAYYLSNRALSSDEAALALNLMHRPYAGVFGHLDVNQAAPPGFLLVQKIAIEAFG